MFAMPDLCCLVSRLSQESLLVAIIVIVVIIVVDWAQEMAEDPLGHVAPLFSVHVRKAEVDAFPDARIHHGFRRPA
jgi:hypothetical protein